MARKIAEVFGFNHGIGPFYADCHFDELSSGSVLCFLNASFWTAISKHLNLMFWARIDDQGGHQGNLRRDTCPMAGSSGFQFSHRPSPLGDAHRIASPLECLTACKSLSHANAWGKGIDSKGWVGNQVFRLVKERKEWDLRKRSPKIFLGIQNLKFLLMT